MQKKKMLEKSNINPFLFIKFSRNKITFSQNGVQNQIQNQKPALEFQNYPPAP